MKIFYAASQHRPALSVVAKKVRPNIDPQCRQWVKLVMFGDARKTTKTKKDGLEPKKGIPSLVIDLCIGTTPIDVALFNANAPSLLNG